MSPDMREEYERCRRRNGELARLLRATRTAWVAVIELLVAAPDMDTLRAELRAIAQREVAALRRWVG